MKNTSLTLIIIAVSSTIFMGIPVAAFAGVAPETSTTVEEHFEKANEFQKLENYDAAIAEYKAVVSLSPKSAIAQNARYWIGQIYFETRQFDDALSTFQKLVDEFPKSMVVPTTKLMIQRVQQAKKNRALFEAIKKADVGKVKLLIAEGADLNAEWVDVYNKGEEIADLHTYWHTRGTALWYAAHVGNIEVVKLLVEAGADVNPGSWPPLCAAVDEDNTAIAEYLIDHGANVNYPKDWGPLQEAATTKSHNIEMVKLLIERGADVNATSWPALHTAISRAKNRDMAEFLIQHGADVNAKDTYGYTPLYYAIRYIYNSDFINLLIAKGAKVDTKCTGGETALMSGAVIGRTEAVKLLLEAGADINAKDDRGQTALHRMMDISYRPSKNMAELLLARGADVNSKDKDGRTPLHLAAESADADIVELLLDNGARINEKDDESGFTALHYAARFGNKDAAEVLIARGADINAKDKQGHTPLQVAVNHDYKVAELLINKGADSGIRAESGQTLLQLAQQRKRVESTTPDMIFDGEPNSLFGPQIACGDVDGDGYDDILIGAPYYNNKRGRVYLFYGGPDMDTTADLILEGQNEGDLFGDGIACGDIDNDGREDIVIGARGYSERRGRAYLYWGGDRNSMDANPDKIFIGDEAKDAQFGAGRPAVCDIDKDGYGDIILGAYISNDRTGRAYLYYGSTKELMDTSADLIFNGENQHDLFGYAISCGDVNHDGYGDIVIGTFDNQGRAYLYYGGSKSNMDVKADVVFKSQSEGNDCFGLGIVCVDQNRDGYDDVVIGARGYNYNQGRAYLFYGSSKRSMDADPDMILDGEVKGSSYGVQEVCGDIDGDKVNDLVIAANGSGQRVGRVYVYWGKDLSAPDPKPGRIFTGENPNDYFGYGLACGDVNNDGFDDLVVGAHAYKAGARQGRVYLYYGGPRNK
jgi:ankyrin repeat protein